MTPVSGAFAYIQRNPELYCMAVIDPGQKKLAKNSLNSYKIAKKLKKAG